VKTSENPEIILTFSDVRECKVQGSLISTSIDADAFERRTDKEKRKETQD
jgi:hypothetical protein